MKIGLSRFMIGTGPAGLSGAVAGSAEVLGGANGVDLSGRLLKRRGPMRIFLAKSLLAGVALQIAAARIKGKER